MECGILAMTMPSQKNDSKTCERTSTHRFKKKSRKRTTHKAKETRQAAHLVSGGRHGHASESFREETLHDLIVEHRVDGERVDLGHGSHRIQHGFIAKS